ncbi:MAG: MATE family efflux transporter, partial [Lachnospiraceae bacterium]|nr:MATE family efflux transporter [Lachnospiraceae bacterium]
MKGKVNQTRYEYMTQTPVPKLITTLAVPTIISMLVTGVYNTADTFFVGRISTQATAAVGLVFSVMAIIQALGFFCGHGSGNYLSRMLGAGNRQEADEMASTGFALALIIGAFVAALGNMFLDQIAIGVGATATTLEETTSYMRIILLGAPFMIGQFVINNQLRFQGSAMFAMIGLMSGAF